MSAEAVRVVEEIQTALTAQDVVSALDDAQADARARRMFMELAEPDFEVVMVGPDYVSTQLEFNGLDGFRDAWRDWTSPFEAYRIEVEETIDGGDRVVSLVAMTGTTRTGGAEIKAPGAAVWTVVDGRVRRVEFHINRATALRAAGLGPGSGPQS
ncbi:MAG TPA: nuclear transport factor 2 family protein [Solirubrobacterales bacterium]|nr:nuclear transport factor 2 family protein [Solirubrobacterales bacterium]